MVLPEVDESRVIGTPTDLSFSAALASVPDRSTATASAEAFLLPSSALTSLEWASRLAVTQSLSNCSDLASLSVTVSTTLPKAASMGGASTWAFGPMASSSSLGTSTASVMALEVRLATARWMAASLASGATVCT